MTILDQAQREEVRWRILKVLDAGRPQPEKLSVARASPGTKSKWLTYST